MKKYLIMFIVATMLLTGCAKENIAPTPTATETQEVKENNTEKQVVTKQADMKEFISINIGSDDGEVGYIEAGDDEMGQCPKSFALDEHGNMYVLDTVNNRILVYNDTMLDSTIDYSKITNTFVDVEKFGVYHGEIFVLDETTEKIYRLKADGELISEIELPEGVEPADVYDFIVIDNELVLNDVNLVGYRYVNQQDRFQLNGKSLNIAQSATEYSIDLNSKIVKLPKKENESLVYIGSNNDMICFSVSDDNFRYVLAYDYDGNILYKVYIDMEKSVHAPIVDVRFDNNKNIYFMSCQENAVKIYKAAMN